MRTILLIGCALVAWPAAALAQDAPRDGDLTARVHGTVVSDDGAPVSGVVVQLSGLDTPGAGRSRIWNEARTTRGDGTFDYPDIPAGDYSVSAVHAGYFLTTSHRVTVSARQTAQVTVTMTRGSAIVGRIVDDFGDPVSEIQVQAIHARNFGSRFFGAGAADVTDDRGQFRLYGLAQGEYIVVATSLARSMLQVQEPERPPTFYPGTLDGSRAQPLSVRAGQDVAVEFALQQGRLYRIRGKVVSPNGQAVPGAQVSVYGKTFLPFRGSSPTAADGSFQLSALPAGTYAVEVRKLDWPSDVEFGAVDVTVGGDDVDGVTIVMARGATLTGTIVFEGDSASRSLPIRVRQLDSEAAVTSSSSLTLLPGGRFEARNVFGRVVFEAGDRNWTLKTVTLGTADVLDRGIDARNRESVSGIHIVATDKVTTVTGRAVDSRGRPLADHIVVLLRTDGVPPRALDGLRSVKTGPDGTFKEWGLRPGRYVAAVVETLVPGGAEDPGFQEQLRLYGQRFSLIEGEAVDLEIAPTLGVR